MRFVVGFDASIQLVPEDVLRQFVADQDVPWDHDIFLTERYPTVFGVHIRKSWEVLDWLLTHRDDSRELADTVFRHGDHMIEYEDENEWCKAIYPDRVQELAEGTLPALGKLRQLMFRVDGAPEPEVYRLRVVDSESSVDDEWSELQQYFAELETALRQGVEKRVGLFFSCGW